ncbi:MAG: proline--tRNA ligase [Acidobacteria bacterium]|nr:proline--tRNA ligase [Acidobacteriota bacterium]
MMRWSQLFIPTLREVPAEAEVVSHQLLLRAGFIRQLGAGIYSYLPLARRTLQKIERIIREEMERIGAQEFYLPALHPAELWQETGRWTEMGDNMFRLKDRTGRELCLGMTHEEVFTSIARNELRSYRDLPQLWYQIQVKFRDEPRPKAGLLRVRQFTMKDSYSFDLDANGLEKSYRLHEQAYRRIFDRCGLEYTVVQAESGAMGGSESEEFMVRTDAGEDMVVSCACGYAANLERAVSCLVPITDDPAERSPELVHTPQQKTIQEVSEFLKVPKSRQIKSLVYVVESKPALILMRGDHQLNESKLSRAMETDQFRPATPDEIRDLFGADPGSLGPVGMQGKGVAIIADLSLQNRRNLICGANRDHYHLLNVTAGIDFTAAFYDLRRVEAADPCSCCGRPLDIFKALEVGHIFKLGYKYSRSMKATVLDPEGKEVPIIMGSYGIGLERIMAAAVELYHDEAGIVWPRSIAPFQVLITLLGTQENQKQLAKRIYDALNQMGIDCLLDDRDERPGVKFKDAELIGVPVRVTIGKKFEQGKVEIFCRSQRELREVDADEALLEIIRALGD